MDLAREVLVREEAGGVGEDVGVELVGGFPLLRGREDAEELGGEVQGGEGQVEAVEPGC